MQIKVQYLPNYVGDKLCYATLGSSGFDLTAGISLSYTLFPNSHTLIRTGVKFEIPQGYEIQVRPRSGLALKQGLTVLNTPGTIDSDYRGEVGVILMNLGTDPVVIEPGMRIAQAVLAPVIQAEFITVDDLSETARGEGGFGSTGK